METMSFIEKCRFERLGVFTYSHEEDTHSHSFEDDVPEDVKQDRANTLMDLQQGISLEINQHRIGETYKILVDREEGAHYIGRTEFDSPEVDNEVLISSDENLKIGEFVTAKVNDVTEFDLYATTC